MGTWGVAESDVLEKHRKKHFRSMMDAGKDAYKLGNQRLAHDLWREAATLDPFQEKVWLALYRVLDNDDDRRVCLQNIIAINPLNVGARRQLGKLESLMARETEAARRERLERRLQQKLQERTRLHRVQRQHRLVVWRAIGIGIGAGILAIAGGIILSILVYGI
jgi:hypothetical protein